MLRGTAGLKKLDEEDRADAIAYDNSMAREILLIRAAENLAQKYLVKMNEVHDGLNEASHGKKTCVAASGCFYCRAPEDEFFQALRRGRPPA